MALLAKVGSIAAPAAAGNQAYTGIGFQPKVVIFFGNGAAADGMGGGTSQDSSMPLYLGFGTGAAGGVMLDDDDFTSGDPWEQNTACIEQQYSNGASGNVQLKASMVSLDADGFTLNWATTFSGKVVNYLALGGTELQASVVHPTVRTTVGSWAITGAGFQPDAAIILLGSNAYSGSNSLGGLGFISKQGTTVKQGCATTSYNGGSGLYQRVDQSIALVDGAGGVKYEASHTSMDTDGMTLNVTTESTVATLQASVLFLKGVQIRSDAIVQKTSTGTQAYTGYGFQPKALLFGGVPKTAGTTVATGGIDWMFGATDGTNRGVVAKQSNTNASHVLDRTKVYKWASDSSTPSVLAAADLSTFDTDGFTLNYTTADATARQLLVLAFGDPAGGGGTAYSLNVSPGSYALTGDVAGTLAGRALGTGPGSFAIAGDAAGTLAGRALGAGPGSLAITGDAAALPAARVIGAAPGAFALTGDASALLADRLLGVDAGSVVVTGDAADLASGTSVFALNAAPAAFVIAGDAAGLLADRLVDAAPGSLAVDGDAAMLPADRVVKATPGAYTATGFDADVALPGAFTLDASPAAFAITGDAAGTLATRKVDAAPGAYALTGDAIGTALERTLLAGPGSTALTGAAAILAARLAARIGTVAQADRALASVALAEAVGSVNLTETAGTLTLADRIPI